MATIDAHVHSAPDSVPRSVTAIETAQLARRHGMRAMLYKNHYAETASLAYLVAQVVPEVEAYGGIALNRSVGGINRFAVERMAMMTGGHGRIVWMPTFDSEHGHRTRFERLWREKGNMLQQRRHRRRRISILL